MNNAANVRALVPAAGRGERLGGGQPKQYLPLAGKALLCHSVEALLAHPRIGGVTVVLAPGDARFSRLQFSRPEAVDHVAGGASRAQSVLNGLRHIGQRHASHWVLVHDAARPCLPLDCLDDLLRAGLDSADGALLAVPLGDTLKAAGADGHVERTVERAGLWAAQTPQLFPRERLEAALRAMLEAGLTPTDEAGAMEHAGARPLLVMGSAANLKVTWAADLELAAAVLAARAVAE